jgi:hypothetical protein
MTSLHASSLLRPLDASPALAQDDIVTASFAQHRLWLVHQYDPGSSAYNMPSAWRLGGVLDVLAFDAAVRTLVSRHEVLRTRLELRDGRLLQRIEPPGASQPALETEDLSHLPAADREARAAQWVRDEAIMPFDLERGPLMRVRLLRLAAADHVLAVTMHHVAADGWSMGIVVRDLCELYSAHAERREAKLPELGLQFGDYAAWEQDWLRGDALEPRLAYWRDLLDGASHLLPLPTDKPRPAVLSQYGDRVDLVLPATLCEALGAVGARAHATLFMTLAAALSVLLHRHSGAEDLCIGYPVAGRAQEQLHDTVGFFVNTLVLRVRPVGSLRFRELLRQVREHVLDAQAHQDMPFDKLVEALKVPRNRSHSPLFQVMLALDNTGEAPLRLPGLDVRALPAPPIAHAKFDLSLSLCNAARALEGEFEFNTELFSRATIELLTEQLIALLQAIAVDDSQRVDELPFQQETAQ